MSGDHRMSDLLRRVLRDSGITEIPNEAEIAGLSIEQKRRLANTQDEVLRLLQQRAILKIRSLQSRLLELRDCVNDMSTEIENLEPLKTPTRPLTPRRPRPKRDAPTRKPCFDELIMRAEELNEKINLRK